MQSVTINMGDMPYLLLQKYATANGKTVNQYITNIIVGWANEHIRGSFLKKMRNKTNAELKQIFGDPEP